MAKTYPGLLYQMQQIYDSGAVAILTANGVLVTGLQFSDSDITGNTINIPGHGLSNFFEVILTDGGGGLPPEFNSGETYVVNVVDANNIQLADTVIDRRNSVYITPTVGTGTNHGVDEAGVSENSGIEYVVLKEVANANNYARAAMPTPVYVTDDTTQQNITTQDIPVSYTATPGNINFDNVCILVGASTTYGDTTGECDSVIALSGAIVGGGPAQDIQLRVSSSRAPYNTVGTD